MRFLVYYRNYKPAKLVEIFTLRGVKYVRVRWDNLKTPDAGFYNKDKRYTENIFRYSECKIVRIPTKIEIRMNRVINSLISKFKKS